MAYNEWYYLIPTPTMEHRLISFQERPEGRAAPEVSQQSESASDVVDDAQRQLLREQRRAATQFVNSHEKEFSQGFETSLAELRKKSPVNEFAEVAALPSAKRFMKEPAIRELMERYQSAPPNVQALLIRRVAEICDRACQGSPEQYVLFRQLFRVAPSDFTSLYGRTRQTQEEFNQALQETNRMTLGFDEVSDREIELAVNDVLPDVDILIRQALDNGTSGGSTLARLLNQKSPDAVRIRRSLDHSGVTQRPPVRVIQWLHNRMAVEGNRKMQESVGSSLKETLKAALKGRRSASAIDALSEALLSRSR